MVSSWYSHVSVRRVCGSPDRFLTAGLFRRVAMAAMRLLHNESPSCFYSIGEMNETIVGLSSSCPMLTLHWCNVLILLNYDDRKFWSQIVQTPQSFKVVTQRSVRQCL